MFHLKYGVFIFNAWSFQEFSEFRNSIFYILSVLSHRKESPVHKEKKWLRLTNQESIPSMYEKICKKIDILSCNFFSKVSETKTWILAMWRINFIHLATLNKNRQISNINVDKCTRENSENESCARYMGNYKHLWRWTFNAEFSPFSLLHRNWKHCTNSL